MKILSTSFVTGALMLIGLATVSVAPSPFALGASARVLLAANNDSPIARDSYVQKARADVEGWRSRIEKASDNAFAKGKHMGKATKNDLSAALSKAETASARLESVATEGWENAKVDYEKASKDLQKAWSKIHPEQK